MDRSQGPSGLSGSGPEISNGFQHPEKSPSYLNVEFRSSPRSSVEKQKQLPLVPIGTNGGPSVPAKPAFRTAFASLSLHMWDRMRLLNFPPHIVDLVRDIIRRTWPGGVQDQRPYAGSFEFKLTGYPWRGHSEEGMHARRLVRTILAELFAQGWVLAFSTDVSKKQNDIDTMLFRYQDPAPAPCEWMSISFSRSDRLRLIDAPQDMIANVVQLLQSATQKQEPFYMPGIFELKLWGNPWWATGEETMDARRLLLQLVQCLEEHGFTVYASIDQKSGAGGDNGGRETDTWHCCRRIGWVPGEPVFHA